MFGGLPKLSIYLAPDEFCGFFGGGQLGGEFRLKEIPSLASVFSDNFLLDLHCNYKSLYKLTQKI